MGTEQCVLEASLSLQDQDLKSQRDLTGGRSTSSSVLGWRAGLGGLGWQAGLNLLGWQGGPGVGWQGGLGGLTMLAGRG